MSGFLTIYNINSEPVDKQLIHSLTQTLKFRGPDRQQVWVDGEIGMGHTLFQTTSEAKYERQPATLDKKVWITCSARIDDRENLVNKLGMKKQINLNNTPDSDLILHAYRKWGEDCLNHLLGDFAFVIWDSKIEKLFCARDRFGTNQLSYTQKNNTLILCNSLHCIRQHPQVSTILNDKAIAGFLLFGDHTWIDKSITVLKDVNCLPPAHKLICQNGEISIDKYWDIPFDLPLLKYKNKSDYIEHFYEIFKTSVADRIRTSSITISMSGGMDSSAIAATVRQLEREKKIGSLELHAVTAVFDRLMPCKERHYAGMVAKHLNIPIHYLAGDDYPLIQSILLTTRPLEIDNSTYWLDVKKAFTSHSRVVLTGASADNLLEYSPAVSSVKEINPLKVFFDLYRLWRLYGKIPALGTGLLSFFKAKQKKNVLISPYPFPEWLHPEFEKKLDLIQMWEDTLAWEPSPLHPRHPAAHNSLMGSDWNTDDIAMKSEFTFAEERDPFLDLRLVTFMFTLPSVPWFFNKHILRESMKDMLPDEIIKRPKTPLGNLQAQLIKEPSSQRIKSWDMNEKLSHYIIRTKAPDLFSHDIDEGTLYQGLRILNLNSWLNRLSQKN